MEPEITAHFESIHELLLTEIGSAETSIVAAVAWFTDREILDALRQRAARGVSVRVAITDDDINRPPKAPAFEPLMDLGGEIHRISPGSTRESLMHHKFCVVDEATVITGSYNWTRRARHNAENVTLVRNHPSFAARFVDTFRQIVGEQPNDDLGVDGGRIRKRLELIRNLIQLGETQEMLPHTNRLRGVAGGAGLAAVVAAIDKRDYERALEAIEDWLARASALVRRDDAEVPYLRLRLQTLEFELEALTAEHADLERRIVVFNRRHDDAIGELIQQVLWARAELKRLQAERARECQNTAEAEEAADFAEEQYREYAEEHERLQDQPAPQPLDEEAERELRRLYRSASRFCHPDKVEEADQSRATEVFQELEAAYRAQDVERVRSIHQMLKNGGLSVSTRSSVLSEADRLRGAIAQLAERIVLKLRQLRTLKESSAVRLMEQVGEGESAFESYVARRDSELRDELAELQVKIDSLRKSIQSESIT